MLPSAMPFRWKVFADEEAIETLQFGSTSGTTDSRWKVFADEEAIETSAAGPTTTIGAVVGKYSLTKKRLRP